MVYGEVGTPPLIVNIKSRVLLFWSSLIICDENNRCNKNYSILYRLLLKLHVLDTYTSPWLKFVKDTLNNIGLSGIWNSQSLPASRECFRQSIKVRLRDQFIHQWITEINESGKCKIFRTFETTFTFENYLISLPRKLKIIFTKFRCRNHRLPIELAVENGFSGTPVYVPNVTLHQETLAMNFITCSYVIFLRQRE